MEKQRRPHSGFTLVEVLISTGILSLILVACYSLIVFAIRWNAKMGDTVDTYQRALKASTRINYDLAAGSTSTFLYKDATTGPTDIRGFAVASARPATGPFQLDSSGRLLMQKWVIYELVDETLYRNEIPIDPPVPKTVLMDDPEPDYLTLRATLTSPGSVQAENLTDFEVEGGASANILFKVEGDKMNDQLEKVNSMTVRSRINFRS